MGFFALKGHRRQHHQPQRSLGFRQRRISSIVYDFKKKVVYCLLEGTYRVKLVLSFHMMFDEHDVVHGFLNSEGSCTLGRLNVTCALHDASQPVVQSVQVPFELFLV